MDYVHYWSLFSETDLTMI